MCLNVLLLVMASQVERGATAHSSEVKATPQFPKP